MAEFKNPQQEPGAERKLLLSFSSDVRRPHCLSAADEEICASAGHASSRRTAAGPSPRQRNRRSFIDSNSGRIDALRQTLMSKQASAETETVIENDLYKITFTNRGAQVKSWILKKFDNDAQNGLLDLVNTAAAQKYGYPLSLWTYDENSAQPAEFRALRGLERRPAHRPGADHLRVCRSGSCSPQDFPLRPHLRAERRNLGRLQRSSKSLPRPHGLPDSATKPLPAAYAAARIDYHNDASTERTGLFFPELYFAPRR